MSTTEAEDNYDATDKISQLHEIIAQNLTIGVSKLGDETEADDLIMDDHVDMKSNASGYSNWRRGSVSYSQPNSPKGNPSLSPVSSVSSISELSTEYQDDGDSESCASLNSATSNESFGAMLHELINKEVIHEHKEECPPLPPPKNTSIIIDKQCEIAKIDHEHCPKTPKKNKSKKSKTSSKSNRSRNEKKLNSKTCLDIPLNKANKKKKKKKLDRITKAKSHNNENNAHKSSLSRSSHRRAQSNMVSHFPSKSHLKSKSKSKSKAKSKLNSKSRPRPKLKQRRSSKDCLDITAISRLTTKSIETWSVSEVVEWVKLIDSGKYKEYADKFRIKKIDGKKLFKMNRSMLQGIDIHHPAARKAILAALQKMKAKV